MNVLRVVNDCDGSFEASKEAIELSRRGLDGIGDKVQGGESWTIRSE